GVEDGLDAIVSAARRSEHMSAGGLNRTLAWGSPRERMEPPRECVSGVERRLSSPDPVEARAMLGLCGEWMLLPNELGDVLKRLADHDDPEIAKLAKRLADRTTTIGR